VVLAFLLIFALQALAVVVLIAAWPGKIAKSRQHPQHQAVKICGWVGLSTGILWAVALVWAYVKETGQGSEVGIASAALDGLSQQIDLLERAVTTIELDSGKASQSFRQS